MRIWITGIAGAVGSHAAERLKNEGHDVSGIDAFTDFYDPALKERTSEELEEQGIGVVRGDLATGDLAGLMPPGTDYVFHFAAQPGISAATRMDDYIRNNLVATERVLEAAAGLARPPGLIYISTSSVYGAHASGDETVLPAPISLYGVTKLCAEQLALSYARTGRLKVAALRFFSVYGERERPDKLFRKLIRAIDAGEPFPLHEGSERHVRSFTYVGDAVESCVRVLDGFEGNSGEIFNIGTDATATTGEAIELLEGIMGKKGIYEARPPRPGDQAETAAKIGKARERLGYAPTTALADGLARQVAWHRRSTSDLL